ncbi:MAG: helix-turn-helix domain-containing protein [Ruminiclostridium sp.]
MYHSIYPMGGAERELPFYVYGIGFNDWQFDIEREQGYPTHQIIYCTRGRGRVIIDGKETAITPGMCFFLPAHYPHAYYTVGDLWETHWIAFQGYDTENLLKRLGFDTAKVFVLNSIDGLEELFRKIYLTMKTDRFFGDFAASGLLYSFILELHRAAFGKAEAHEEKSSPLVTAVNYIDEHYTEDIELEELCRISGVTPQHLCRIFKKQLNMRPVEYISKKRIQCAKNLLLTTDKPIGEIASAAGYRDISYFGVIFKRCEGMTPGEYRKRCSR